MLCDFKKSLEMGASLIYFISKNIWIFDEKNEFRGQI